jgi:twinfilin-like protein
LELPGETVALASQDKCSASDLAGILSSDEPRFSFFRYREQPSSPVIFIYTCPSGSKVKERMVYASSRRYVVSNVAEEAGLTIAKKMEASDPAEISAAALEDEFRLQKEETKAFERPRRPGRR